MPEVTVVADEGAFFVVGEEGCFFYAGPRLCLRASGTTHCVLAKGLRAGRGRVAVRGGRAGMRCQAEGQTPAPTPAAGRRRVAASSRARWLYCWLAVANKFEKDEQLLIIVDPNVLR